MRARISSFLLALTVLSVCLGTGLHAAPLRHALAPKSWVEGDFWIGSPHWTVLPSEAPKNDHVAVLRPGAAPVSVKGFRLMGVSSQNLEQTLTPFVGAQKSYTQLQEAAKALENTLRQRGYSLAQTSLPMGPVVDGVVPIKVRLGRLGSLRMAPKRGTKSRLPTVRAAFANWKPGRVILQADLDAVVADLKRNEGLEVDPVFRPAMRWGVANLVLEIHKEKKQARSKEPTEPQGQYLQASASPSRQAPSGELPQRTASPARAVEPIAAAVPQPVTVPAPVMPSAIELPLAQPRVAAATAMPIKRRLDTVADPLPPASPKSTVTLAEMVVRAVSSHPQVLSALSQVKAADDSVDTANWQFFPTPTVTYEGVSTKNGDPSYAGDPSQLIFRVQQPLWAGGRLAAGVDKAQADRAATIAGLEDAKLQIAQQVVEAYGDWLNAKLRSEAGEKNYELHKRLIAMVQARADQGLSARNDVVLAQARLDALTADMAFLKSRFETARAKLVQLVGSTDLGTSVFDQVPLLPPNDVQAMVAKAEEFNPRVKKAEFQAQSYKAAIDLRKADLYPQIYARYEHQVGNYAALNAPVADRFFIGLTTSFGPGLSTGTQANNAESLYLAAQDEAKSQRRMVAAQVAADRALFEATESRFVYAERTRSANAEILASYERQFLAGRKAWLDLMNSARELNQAQELVADLRSTRTTVGWRLSMYVYGLDSTIDWARR